ncbi:MAG: phosphoribosylanthranilate isomerase [candidate division KSB1 bacterium]|nr:phosphoribosylanthranilate isomerase [candidate division KSB1 bacterium]
MIWKVCGMTRRKDINCAVECGVEWLGFIFAPSPRQVNPEQVRELTRDLSGVETVGVFMNQAVESVRKVRDACRLDRVQLHGDESPEYCRELGGSIIKAFRVRDARSLNDLWRYSDSVMLLLDAWEPQRAGGTGKRISLDILDQVADYSRVILAGGVGPDNALTLIERYHPFGLDMNSALEMSPGIKDHYALKQAAQLLDRI